MRGAASAFPSQPNISRLDGCRHPLLRRTSIQVNRTSHYLQRRNFSVSSGLFRKMPESPRPQPREHAFGAVRTPHFPDRFWSAYTCRRRLRHPFPSHFGCYSAVRTGSRHENGPQSPCRLRQGRARGHQVVDQHDPPAAGQQPRASRGHLQGTGEIVQPLPGVEPRLVGHGTPLPQYGDHPGRCPRTPQLTRRGERDPPCRVVPPRPDRPGRGRHGNERHGRPSHHSDHSLAGSTRPLAPQPQARSRRRSRAPPARPPPAPLPEAPRASAHPVPCGRAAPPAPRPRTEPPRAPPAAPVVPAPVAPGSVRPPSGRHGTPGRAPCEASHSLRTRPAAPGR